MKFLYFMRLWFCLLFALAIAFAYKQSVAAQSQSKCPANTPTHFTVGQYGVVSPTPKGQQPTPDKVHAAPTADSNVVFTMTDGTYFQVIDGPSCADGYVWWKIHATSGDGWVAEGTAARNFIDPVTVTGTPPAAASFTCGSGLPTRLAVGSEGVVLTVDHSNVLNVRADAGTASRLITVLPAGQQFAVVDGPKCADGSVWWKVQANETTGWIAEDNATSYFVQPLGGPIPTQTPTPTPSPTATLRPSATLPPSPTPTPSITPSPLPPSATPRFSVDANQPLISYGTLSTNVNVDWSPHGDQLLLSPLFVENNPHSAVYAIGGQKLYDEANIQCPSPLYGWTPDGNLICVVQDDWEVFGVHGEQLTVFPSRNQPAPAGLSCPCTLQGQGFFPDGRFLFKEQFADNSYQFGIDSADGSFAQWIGTHVFISQFISGEALSNNQVLVYTDPGTGGSITIIDLSGAVKHQFNLEANHIIVDNTPDGSMILAGQGQGIGVYKSDGTLLGIIPLNDDSPSKAVPSSIVLSPNGQWIAMSQPGGVALFNNKGVPQGKIAFNPPIRNFPSLFWSPDSSTLAISSGGNVWLVNVTH